MCGSSPLRLVCFVPVSGRPPHLQGPLWSHCCLFPSSHVSQSVIISFTHLSAHVHRQEVYLSCLQLLSAEQALSPWVWGSREWCGGRMAPALTFPQCQRVWWLSHLYLPLATPSVCCNSSLVRDHFQLKSTETTVKALIHLCSVERPRSWILSFTTIDFPWVIITFYT